MRIDASQSVHHEAPEAAKEFSRGELRSLRLLLRRLRFLEAQIARNGGLRDGSASGGAAFTEYEAEALEWILTEVGFLADEGVTISQGVSRNGH